MQLRRFLLAGRFCVVAGIAATPPATLRWRHYENPVFPVELLSTPLQSGFVDIAFTFDADGRITDRIAVAASHPAFVASVFEAVRGWQVESEGLAPHVRRETIRFEFERHHNITAMNQREATKASFSKLGDAVASALTTFRESDLKRPLRTLATVAPEYPPSLATSAAHGTATVGFVVDTEGRVRVPAVTDATEPEFAAAALAAIRQWRFEPPRQDQVPVQVMTERTFRFGPAAKR